MPPFGINLANKPKAGGGGLRPPPGNRPANKRKKTIFDDSDSDDEDTTAPANKKPSAIEITTLGGVDDPPPSQPPNADPRAPKRKPQPHPTDPKPPTTLQPLSKTSIFANDSDSDPSTSTPDPQTTYGLTTKPTAKAPKDHKQYTNLSAQHSSRQHQTQAASVDPSIYSYDSIYDTLHAKPPTRPPKNPDDADDAVGTVPKYMTALLRSAEIRKRDQLRARDRQLAKEREAEGDEFADKERFVTAAYKAQQAEMRRIEAEEAAREAREEADRRANGGTGMVGFYRELLARGEEQHAAVVRAAEEAAAKNVTGGEEGAAGEGEKSGEEKDKDKSEAQVAAERNARGAHIAVNDDGQVVDKRQLLAAGLNVAPKPKVAPPGDRKAGERVAGASTARFGAKRGADRGGQRARQTEMIAAQLEERARQEEEAEAARQKEIAERSRSSKTQGDVSSARERYLARKKEREAAA
ncbi:hypothetical protein BP00DRAFT_314715, partial [Aspergillus indologenus CBS 114.80]